MYMLSPWEQNGTSWTKNDKNKFYIPDGCYSIIIFVEIFALKKKGDEKYGYSQTCIR